MPLRIDQSKNCCEKSIIQIQNFHCLDSHELIFPMYKSIALLAVGNIMYKKRRSVLEKISMARRKHNKEQSKSYALSGIRKITWFTRHVNCSNVFYILPSKWGKIAFSFSFSI